MLNPAFGMRSFRVMFAVLALIVYAYAAIRLGIYLLKRKIGVF